jgi:multicomponent K+:H+ antiporter subunit E
MKRLLPAPLLSAALLLCWLMLNQSVSVGQWVLGAALALAVPWFTERLRPDKPNLKAWGTALRLAGVVLADIVLSNVEVARRVLGPEAALHPGWVWVPLDIRDPHGIAALAGIITLTPGTLSAELSEDRRHLLVHAFDLADAAELVADIKTRYEAPLRAIFE